MAKANTKKKKVITTKTVKTEVQTGKGKVVKNKVKTRRGGSAVVKELAFGKESWINPLRDFEFLGLKTRDCELEVKISEGSKSPLYFIDSLGLQGVSNGPDLGIVSELSVTKFAMIAKCPRKFYFSQILKYLLRKVVGGFFFTHS